MAKVLVTYYSKSGNTGKMADIIVDAAKAAGATVVRKRAEDVTPQDLVAADAIAIGSPDYFSYPAGWVKSIFDDALEVKAKLSGKPGVCFSSHGGGAKIKGPFENLMKAVGLALVTPCVLSQEAPAGEAIEELQKAAATLVKAAGK